MSKEEYEIKVEVTYTCRGSVDDAYEAIENCFGRHLQGAGVCIANGAYAWKYKSHKLIEVNHNAPTP